MAVQPIETSSVKDFVQEFFRRSEGQWLSQRRYYTLNQEEEPQEVISQIRVKFLAKGHDALLSLAHLHGLGAHQSFLCGTEVSWESTYISPERAKPSIGSTVFGIKDNVLYRDRGFATSKPVTAHCTCFLPQTLALKTEYNNSVFEEEIKLIGERYRTRQTVISKANQEILIGQYLEKKVL